MASMLQTYTIPVALSVVLLSVVHGSSAAEHSHEHGRRGSTPALCETEAARDMLQCSRAASATFDYKGRLWLAWASSGHVYVSHSDDKGQSYSPPVMVNRVAEKIAARGENRPKIKTDRQGNVLVSWTQRLEKRYSGHVRFSRSVDGGRHFSTPLTVNDHREVTSHRFDALAVSDDGRVTIAWLDKRDKLVAQQQGKAYRGAALYYAVSTDGGEHFHTNSKVLDHSCECCRVAITLDRAQLPVLMWRHIYGKNTRDHALVRFTSAMQAGQVRRVSYDNWQVDGCPHHGPAINIASDDTYHLTWFNNAPERHGLFYAYSHDQVQTLSTSLNFGNYRANASHPQVASMGKDVFLAWQEFDGRQASLWLMHSKDGGKQWSSAATLATTDGNVDYPQLITDHDTVYAAWHIQGQAYQLLPLSKR